MDKHKCPDCGGDIIEESKAIITDDDIVEGVVVYCSSCEADFTEEVYG